RPPTRHSTNTCRFIPNVNRPDRICLCSTDLASATWLNFRWSIAGSIDPAKRATALQTRGAHFETNESCPERRDPLRSMIGAEQEAWLFNGLTHSSARWNVIGQDVLMAQLRQRMPDGNFGYWTDNWDGYPASRTRLLQHISRSRTRNPRSEERRVGKECRTGL